MKYQIRIQEKLKNRWITQRKKVEKEKKNWKAKKENGGWWWGWGGGGRWREKMKALYSLK